jgi:hypothetical protein
MLHNRIEMNLVCPGIFTLKCASLERVLFLCLSYEYCLPDMAVHNFISDAAILTSSNPNKASVISPQLPRLESMRPLVHNLFPAIDGNMEPSSCTSKCQ